MSWKIILILLFFIVGYTIIEIFIGWDTLRFLTYLLVIVTGYYALQTGNMVGVVREQTNKTINEMQQQIKEMRQQTKEMQEENKLLLKQIREQNRPNIRIQFKLEETQLHMQIDNIGRECAKELKCIPDPDFQVPKYRKFSNIEIMKLPMLFGGEMRKVQLGDVQDIRRSLNKATALKVSPLLNKNISSQELEELKKFFITCTYAEENGEFQKIKIQPYIPKKH